MRRALAAGAARHPWRPSGRAIPELAASREAGQDWKPSRRDLREQEIVRRMLDDPELAARLRRMSTAEWNQYLNEQAGYLPGQKPWRKTRASKEDS